MEIIYTTRTQYFLYCFFKIPYLKENCTNILLSFIYYIQYLQALSTQKGKLTGEIYLLTLWGLENVFFKVVRTGIESMQFERLGGV